PAQRESRHELEILVGRDQRVEDVVLNAPVVDEAGGQRIKAGDVALQAKGERAAADGTCRRAGRRLRSSRLRCAAAGSGSQGRGGGKSTYGSPPAQVTRR